MVSGASQGHLGLFRPVSEDQPAIFPVVPPVLQYLSGKNLFCRGRLIRVYAGCFVAISDEITTAASAFSSVT